MTPRAAWQEAVARKKEPVRYPANGDEFFLDFLPAVPRRIQKDGIHFCKIRYWDNVLSSWAGRSKQTFLVKYDPRNLSRLYVRDSDGRHWPVPYADLRQPAIALWELEEARKRSGRNGRRAADSEAIFANILQQRQIVNEAVSHAKQRRRQEQTPLDFPVPRRIVAKLEETASGDVKAYPVEIWGELE